MACAEAVEDVVVEHYRRQLDRLEAREPKLRAMIERIHDEERELGNSAVELGACRTTRYRLLYQSIRHSCRVADRNQRTGLSWLA